MKIAIGLDIGGTFSKIVLVRENGDILFSQQYTTPAVSGNDSPPIEDLLTGNVRDFLGSETVTGLIAQHSAASRIAGIGIGIAGFIDRASGKIIKSPNLSAVDGLPIKEIFKREFSLPVVVENDANAYAYGEKWTGAGRDLDSFVVLTLGTGLGGGYIYKGELYDGPFEIGHVVIEPSGRFCTCGGFGCLESYVSGRAIVDRVVNSIQGGVKSSLVDCCEGNYYKITPELVFQQALDGDSLSREVFREVGSYLGLGIANMINTLRLDAVIIGGGLIGAWDLFIEELIKEAFKRGLKPFSANVKILKSALSQDAGSLGAAGLLFKSLL